MIKESDFVMLSDWNFWLSIATAFIAIVAILLSYIQIRLSNKHHLFDERIENFITATGLIKLYQDNKNHLKDWEKEDGFIDVEFHFGYMTNNSYLVQDINLIRNPLQNPYQKEFLVKLEDIKNVATKSEFLFKGKNGILLKDFIFCYQELLFTMYQYGQIEIKIREINDEESKKTGKALTIKEAQKRIGEERYRPMLRNAIKNLEQAYDQLVEKNVIEKIRKKTKF